MSSFEENVPVKYGIGDRLNLFYFIVLSHYFALSFSLSHSFKSFNLFLHHIFFVKNVLYIIVYTNSMQIHNIYISLPSSPLSPLLI